MKILQSSDLSIVQLEQPTQLDTGRRDFSYTINKRKTKAKLLRGAKRIQNLEVEVKSGCTNLRFCDGSFFEVVLPVLNEWRQKVHDVVIVQEKSMEILDLETGFENSEKHMDTKLVVMVENERIVLHAYNSTQNLMVQSKNHEHFAVSCLKPFFLEKIKFASEKITQFNTGVIQSLEPDRVKVKSFNCPQCAVKNSSMGDLKVHMKKCHTKPSLNSPHRNKVLKLAVYSESSPVTDNSIVPVIPNYTSSPRVCGKCEFSSENYEEFACHIENSHGSIVNSERECEVTGPPEVIQPSFISCDVTNVYFLHLTYQL